MLISQKPCKIEGFRRNFWAAGYLCRVAIPIFKNILSRQNWRPFWIFEFFTKIGKHKNAYISKTVLDRADYTDFGCHNSIRLEAEHFLNTSALTVISFSGRFVFAVQKHSFFCKRSSCRHTWFPVISRKSIHPMFTNFGMGVYWVNSLHGIAFVEDSSKANWVIAT